MGFLGEDEGEGMRGRRRKRGEEGGSGVEMR
jgi:hypothetical protein